MAQLDIFRLDGRVAVVAGGGGAIGSVLAEAFAGAGARVVAAGRSRESCDATIELVRAAGSEGLGITADMTSEDDCDRMVAETLERFGQVDILVNAVGGGAGKVLHPAESYPRSDWDWIMELNVRSTILPGQAVARAMIERGQGGRILNLSSVRANLGINSGYSAYVAAKGAMDALTRQHATEWAKHGIRVNAISPTFVRTEQAADLLKDEDFYNRLVARIPLRRIADTDDLVGAVLFFCSDASSFVTGQILTLDGGLTATQ
jgi:NAD(P)-dependent dehydrogenase (short-subunit alcohol dehydrogenase family)